MLVCFMQPIGVEEEGPAAIEAGEGVSDDGVIELGMAKHLEISLYGFATSL